MTTQNPTEPMVTADPAQQELAMAQREIVRLRAQLVRLQNDAATAKSLHAGLEAAQLALWQWDIASGRVSLSARWGIITSTEAKASSQPLEDFLARVHPDDICKIRHQLAELMAGRSQRYTAEHRLSCPSGWIWIESSGLVSQRDSDGKVSRMTGTHADITARKAIEQDLAGARAEVEQSSHAKSEFLANMSHEVRTPLNAIMGLTRLLHKTPLDPEQKNFLGLIDNSAAALLAVVNDVLDLSKIEAGKLIFEEIRFDLQDWIEKCVAPTLADASAKGLQLSLDMSHKLPTWLVGDPGRLRQVLANLLSNAVKFTQRGEISVRVWPDPNQKGVPAGELRLLFHVRDSGIGMTVQQQKTIFNAFTQADATTTREFGGTGLGLTICERLVTMMGGKIRVSSAPGLGSAFRFSAVFRQASQLARQLTLPAALEARSFTGLRVLLAEDHPVNQLLTRKLLEELGCIAEVVSNGAEAVARWQQGGIDLLLMDVQMPAMGGEEATAKIRSEEAPRHSHTPIVALTAHALAGDREKYLAAGMDAYASKPISPDTLTHAMHAALQTSQQLTNLLPESDFSFAGAPPPPAAASAAAAGKVATTRALETLNLTLRLRLMGGDRADVAEVAAALRLDISQRLPRLQQAADTEDSGLAGQQSHALKGALASCALNRGAELARLLEQAVRNHDWERFRRVLVIFLREAQQIDQALAQLAVTQAP